MKQIEKFTINSHDIDLNGFASSSSILRYLQETANLEHYRHGPTTEELRADGKAFIVSKITINYYRPLKAFDEITVESWLCRTQALSFLRCGRILHNDICVAELTSIWALVDINNHKLLRADDISLGFGYDEPLEMESPPRILIPHGLELSLAGERLIGYSDVDLNRHMNNTNYFDMFCGFIPSMENKTVISAAVNFNSEAPLGETIKIYRYCNELEEVYYFRSLRDGGAVNAEAVIKLDTII